MHKINPDDLDAIFKEGADKYEFTYNEAAWAAMSTKLDKKDRNRKLWLFFSLLAILSLAIGTWAYLTKEVNKPFTQSPNEIVDANTIPNSKSTEIESSAATTSNQDINSQTTQIANKDINTASNTTKTEANKENFFSRSTNAIGEILTEVRAFKNSKTISKKSAEPSSKTNVANNTTSITNFTVVENTPSTNTPSTVKNDRQVIAQSTTDLAADKSRDHIQVNSFSGTINALTINHKDIATPNFADVALSTLASTSTSKYFFSVHAATEWSSVGFLKEPSMGWKAGLGAGIALSNFIELNTGLGISRKVYASQGLEYEMQGGWIEDVMPESLESKCYILDIPVNVTYYVNGRNENGFFFSGGLSSYIISSEWYGFNYTAADMEQLDLLNIVPQDEVFEQNESHHYVGVANLSVGMQRRMKNGIFLQFAPYVQIPLTGIGAGKVDLYSTGFKLAVKLNK